MNQERLFYLIDQLNQGTASDEELAEYNTYMNQRTDNPGDWNTSQMGGETETKAELLTRIEKASATNKVRTLWPRIAAAASVLLFLSAGTYFILHKTPKPAQLADNHELIAPVQKGIVLTLANGKKMIIDQKYTGRTKAADGTHIEQDKGTLKYQEETAAATEPQMHTLTNNSGNKYSLVLADGTEANLDVASSITYPVIFTGKERQVTITGQAYFKVKHNATQPFLVSVKNETIEDIGTEFNVDAYDAVLKTTLVEGSVRINRRLLLKPGEQAQFNGTELTTVTADLEAATSWLEGKLVFNHEPLESILEKVARIYDVQIIWQDEALKHIKFGGAVSRTKKLNTVLNFFRKTGKVDFKVDGKTVQVIKHISKP
jgi:transmembrane sensor